MPYGPNGEWYDYFPKNRPFGASSQGTGFTTGPHKNPVKHRGQLLYLLNNYARASLGIPGMFTMGADGKVSLSPEYLGMVGYAFQSNLANIVLKTVAQAEVQVIDSMYLLAQAIALEGSEKHIERANKQLAAEMRKALVARYGQSVEKRKQTPSYPRVNRLSGNLRRAISQPDMAVGSATGIKYINQDRLNAEAKHWARINFGVQGAPGARRGAARSAPPEQFELLSSGKGGRGAGTLGFKNKPRPPMYLPPGFWEFIGGHATGATQRTSKIAGKIDKAEEHPGDARARATARRQARVAERLGGQGSASPSMNARQFESIASIQGGKDRGLSSYSRRLTPTSGTSSWGADYGGVPKTIMYRKTTHMKVGGKDIEKRRSVTSVTRGVRRSRQAFKPTRKGPWYPTAGVVASNFMDAGFRALSEKADKIYFQAAQNMLDEASDTTQGKALKKLLVKHKVTFAALGGTNAPREIIRPKRDRGSGPEY